MLKIVGNIIWLLFGGIELAIAYALAGIVMIVLIITIPWGIGAFRLAAYALWPFGRKTVRVPSAGSLEVVPGSVEFEMAALRLAAAT